MSIDNEKFYLNNEYLTSTLTSIVNEQIKDDEGKFSNKFRNKINIRWSIFEVIFLLKRMKN